MSGHSDDCGLSIVTWILCSPGGDRRNSSPRGRTVCKGLREGEMLLRDEDGDGNEGRRNWDEL